MPPKKSASKKRSADSPTPPAKRNDCEWELRQSKALFATLEDHLSELDDLVTIMGQTPDPSDPKRDPAWELAVLRCIEQIRASLVQLNAAKEAMSQWLSENAAVQ